MLEVYVLRCKQMFTGSIADSVGSLKIYLCVVYPRPYKLHGGAHYARKVNLTNMCLHGVWKLRVRSLRCSIALGFGELV